MFKSTTENIISSAVSQKRRAFICAFFLAGCEVAPAIPPERPIDIPKNSVWRGGEDGGNWQYCEYRADNIIQCTIYFSGLDWYAVQDFRACGEDVDYSDWPVFLSGEGTVSIPIRSGVFNLIPSAPLTVYRNGVVDEALSRKSVHLFTEIEQRKCVHPVMLKSP